MADTRTRLRQFISEHSERLRATLRAYAARAAVPVDADELLSETVLEALESAERFDPARQPHAWLLGIAANLLRRRTAAAARLERREPLVRDLFAESDAWSDDDLFDRFASLAQDARDDEAQVEALLRPLLPDDRRVLLLAIVLDMDGAAVGRELGITPGAARVRLHRAIGRLRAAYAHDHADEGPL